MANAPNGLDPVDRLAAQLETLDAQPLTAHPDVLDSAHQLLVAELVTLGSGGQAPDRD